MPEVSVIVPNYNHFPYLNERIDSIIDQTFEDIEIILLDDCSTDKSIEVLEGYRHSPKVSRVIVNEQNTGSTFKQWEKGIEQANGKWIWIAESDDWCEKTFLETFIPAFDDSNNCSIAFCQSHALSNDGRIIMTTSNPVLEEILPGKDFIERRMLHMNSIFNASMCIFRKELYHQVSKKFTHYKFCGDWLFWIEMAALGNVFVSGKVLNYFRKHEKDVSGNAYRSGLYYEEYLQLTDDLLEMEFIDASAKKKLIEQNFNKYYFEKPSDKNREHRILQKYKTELGYKYYTASARSFYKKCKNELFLITLAIKRRLKSRPQLL